MPNWSSNTLRITGAKKRLDEIEATEFDFEKIIPMPKELSEDVSSTCVKCHKECPEPSSDTILTILDSNYNCKECDITENIGGRVGRGKSADEVLKEASLTANEKLIACEWIIKYGTCSWYTWRHQNWGTKWSASEIEIERISDTELEVYFAVPWDSPVPILEKISKGVEIAVRVDNEGDDSYEQNYEDGIVFEPKLIEGENTTMWIGGAPSKEDMEENKKI
tara:strand:+ start:27320 stop:27985 length:666 start_codon:yes stop_codon:yes gene_type:complete